MDPTAAFIVPDAQPHSAPSPTISIITPDITVTTVPPLKASIVLSVQHDLDIPSHLADRDYPQGSHFPLRAPLHLLLETNPAPDLSLDCVAVIDGRVVAPRNFHQSAVLNHLRSFIENNLSQLGLQRVLPSFTDEDNPKFYLESKTTNPTCCASSDLSRPILRRLRLCYKLLPDPSASSTLNPFEHAMTLPYFVICNRLCGELVTKHLMRYPRIFSPYNERVMAVAPLWTSIARNIANISERSQRFEKLVNSTSKHLSSVLASERRYLQNLLVSGLGGKAEETKCHTYLCAPNSILESTLQELHRVKFSPDIKLKHHEYRRFDLEHLEDNDQFAAAIPLDSGDEEILDQSDGYPHAFSEAENIVKESSSFPLLEGLHSPNRLPLEVEMPELDLCYQGVHEDLNYEASLADALDNICDPPLDIILEPHCLSES